MLKMLITPGEILRFPRKKRMVRYVANHSALGWAESVKWV